MEEFGGKRTLRLQGRYAISVSQELGEGCFAKVYKGLDKEMNRNVAVKVFRKESPDFVNDFETSVHTLRSLETATLDIDAVLGEGETKKKPTLKGRMEERRGSFGGTMVWGSLSEAMAANGEAPDYSKMKEMLSRMDLHACFGRLYDYSGGLGNNPCQDAEYGLCFTVHELGEESMAEMLAQRGETGDRLNVEELRSLHWGLVSIVCALHAVGFVHLDIKPSNIVRFGDTWKLIDFDGAVPVSQRVMTAGNIMASPSYLAPELATALLRANEGPDAQVAVSRLADVWSVGMVALEAVILSPVLDTILGVEDDDPSTDMRSLTYLADPAGDALISGEVRDVLEAMNSDMCDLLAGMLTKSPQRRLSIGHCFVHAWFAPVREKLWRDYTAPSSHPGRGHLGRDGSKTSPSGRKSRACTTM